VPRDNGFPSHAIPARRPASVLHADAQRFAPTQNAPKAANGWRFLYHGMEQEPTYYDPGIYNGGN
jgi:hypothetical protein